MKQGVPQKAKEEKPVEEEQPKKNVEKEDEFEKNLKKEEEPKKNMKKAKKVKQMIVDSDDDVSCTGLEPGSYWIDEKRMRRIQVSGAQGEGEWAAPFR